MKCKFLVCFLIVSFVSNSQKQLDVEANFKLVEELNKLSLNKSSQNIYIQTDKDIYETAEDLWFKAYVLNSSNLTPSSVDNVLFVQLINEDTSDIIFQEKYKIQNGISKGHVFLKEDLKEGNYFLVGHTASTLNSKSKELRSLKRIKITKSIIPKTILDVEYDKEVYASNDEVFINISVLSNGNNPIDKAKITAILYKESEKVDKQKITTNKEGIADLSFDFSKIGFGNRLQLTIEFDGNKTVLNKKIPLLKNASNIQFGLYPEGGSLVSGLSNKMAFKAVGFDGEPIVVKGVLYKNNTIVNEIESTYDGMGSFIITPEERNEYYVKIVSPELDSVFQFPPINKEGLVLKVTDFNKNTVGFKILRTEAFKNQKIYARAQIRGNVVWMGQGMLAKKNTLFNIPTNILPQGILEITIFNESYLPIAERLVYVNHEDYLFVDYIELDKSEHSVKNKVELSFSLKDKHKKPVQANLGLSVFNHLRDDSEYNTIQTQNYLFTDLRGKIHNPHSYFDLKNDKRKEGLDLLLLTQGWRSYNWSEDVLKTIQPIIQKEFSEDFNAIVYSKNKNGTLNRAGETEIQFVSPDAIDLIKTTNKGTLNLPSFIFEELQGYQFFLKTLSDTLLLKEVNQFNEINKLTKAKDFWYPKKIKIDTKTKNRKMLEEFSFNSINYLEEVEIVAYKKNSKHLGSNVNFESSTSDYVCWEYSILNCRNHRNGLKPTPGATYFLNSGKLVTYVAPEINKTDTETKVNKGFVFLKGFYPQKRFYSPVYDTEDSKLEPDNRSTLYWEPEIITDKNGEAKISFYTSDIRSTYIIKIEGVDEKGRLCYKEMTFKVK